MANTTSIQIQPIQTTQRIQTTEPIQQNTPIIQIGFIETLMMIAALFIGIGISWGTLKTKIEHIADTLENNVGPDLKNIRERFIIVEDRVKTLWKDEVAPAHSPRRLNERGNNILNNSGIKTIIDEKKNDFLIIIKAKKMTNPYDAEQCVLQVVNDLKRDLPIIDRLKNGAFSVGADIDTVLLVGGLYLRDLIFPDLGFSVDQIDQHKTT